MMREENHVFQGMRRDNHPIKQDSQFLWDARNIRITNREGDSMLSITNEKGTSDPLLSFTNSYYVGHCIVGKYLVIFMGSDDPADMSVIYRVEKNDNGFSYVILYRDKEGANLLELNPDYPIQSFGYVESEFVQKVYWIDGKHQPRVINVALPELKEITFQEGEDLTDKLGYTQYSFDFVQSLSLKERVTVSQVYGSGSFAPGTIQYAFTYYNRYGSESNIFYTTPLNYISPYNRGGNPEEVIPVAFSIQLENLDKFDYLRAYSIHRTSLDAIATVKLVGDYYINGADTITIADDGVDGSIIDPTQLLYIGGEDIIPQTMCEKDGTLFFGSYKLNRPPVPDEVKEALSSYVYIDPKDESEKIGTYGEILTKSRSVILPYTQSPDSQDYYYYYSQLRNTDTSYFQPGEHYRLGIQFQHQSGKWSEPVCIHLDYTVPTSRTDVTDEDKLVSTRPQVKNNVLTLPFIKYALSEDFYYPEDPAETPLSEILKQAGYKKARGVVVFPSLQDKKIVAQGILCPTVFNYNLRKEGLLHSQSSWFFRPNISFGNDFFTSENMWRSQGFYPECRHYCALKRSNTFGAEIQSNIPLVKDGAPVQVDYNNVEEQQGVTDEYLIDQSILTFHSPDIEFNESINATSLEGCSLNIVGIAPITSSQGSLTLNTSSSNWRGRGFMQHRTQINCFNSDYKVAGKQFLTSPSYEDSNMVPNEHGEINPGDVTIFLTYPWHRSGSLSNDYKRDGRTGVLETKTIFNQRFSDSNIWLKQDYTQTGGIESPQIWRTEQASLIKVGNRPYLGNVDQLVYHPSFRIYTYSDSTGITSSSTVNSEPIRVKYKSTTHAVISLQQPNSSTQYILPKIPNQLTSSVTAINGGPKQEFNGASISYLHLEYISNTYVSEEQGFEHIIVAPNQPYSLINLLGIHRIGDIYSSGNFQFIICTYQSNSTTGKFRKPNAEEIRNKGIDKGSVIRVWDGNKYRYLEITALLTSHRGMVSYKEVTSNYTEIDPNKTVTITQAQLIKSSQVETEKDIADFRGDFLYVGELVRDTIVSPFGGYSEEQIAQTNTWIPASEPVDIETGANSGSGLFEIWFTQGDTFYQRYDCLKTYPYTRQDENQIVDIGSFMCETKINIDGRYDRNRGVLDNYTASPQNFNLFNNVYSQRNNFFSYKLFNKDYYKLSNFTNQVTWTKQKNNMEDVDAWTNVTLANTLDMSGQYGAVTSLNTFNESLVCFQEKALSQILFNSRAQIQASDGVPIEIANGYKVDGSRLYSSLVGCQDKSTTCTTPYGLYFIDYNTDTLWLFNGQLQDVSSSKGMQWWLRTLDNQYNDKNNDSTVLKGTRIISFYDNINQDLYLVPWNKLNSDPSREIDVLCYSEKLQQFTSFFSYNGAKGMFNFEDGFYSLLTPVSGGVNLYQHFVGDYNNFYGEFKPFSFSFISNENPTLTKVFDTIEYRSDFYLDDSYPEINTSFNYLRVSNEYQDSKEYRLDDCPYKLRKKFRVWRAQLPRNYGTRERIRNPWTKITLGYDRKDSKKMILHDISVKYTV